jgi:hypothetical protein
MKSGKTRRVFFILAALALCALVPAVARAQSEPEKRQQAKEHYEKATRFYDVGKYGEAINEYEQAYLLIEDAALLFNIGQAYRLWERPEDAIRAYKNYLRKRPEASNRPDVEKKISDLEKLIEDRRQGVAPPSPPTQPPTHPVQPVQPPPVTGGGTTTIQPIAPIQPPPALPPGGTGDSYGPGQPSGLVINQPPPTETPPTKSQWLPYTLISVGGVCIVTALVAGAVGASKAKKLEDASKNHDVFDPAVQSNGKSANAIAFVSAIVGLASGGVGGYLLWRSRRSDQPMASISATVTPVFAGGSAILTF